MAERTHGVARLAATGLVRSTAFAGVALLIPAAVALIPSLAGAHLLGRPWSWTKPWSWGALASIATPVTLALAHPVAVLTRRLLARWTGLELADGYRKGVEPVRMSTGFWWNGVSYERTREDAQADLRARRVLEPAYWREVRWALVAALAIAPVCILPVAGVLGAAVLLTLASPARTAGAVGLVAAGMAVAPFSWRLVRPLAQRWLASGPVRDSSTAELRAQRADLTAAHDAEIRRIERDLHDGAQARLVAVGLDLATAERLMKTDPEQAAALLEAARAGTAESLNQLRELVHGIYPPVLIERGLVPALRAMALDSPLDIRVQLEPGPRVRDNELVRMPSPLESALYFSVSELVANLARHSGATRSTIVLRTTREDVEIVVADNGHGGATLRQGGGLDGIRRRIAAFDGTLEIFSPHGGPTEIAMRLPCE